jgi:peptide chain release factor subunit 1
MPTDQLSTQLDRLALFDAGPFPVVSLYLDMRPDQCGRERFDPFLRKELAERLATFETSGPERQSLERDAARIRSYVEGLDHSANSLALFTCSAAELFEAMPLAAPIPEHRLYISDRPHLYPLARLIDEYPRAAFLLANTNSARLLVAAANTVERVERVENVKTKRHKMGGWSQARYQRHVENFHLHHAKDVVDVLTRVVREERIASIIVAGDEVVVPLLRDQLPKDVADRVVEVVKLDVRAPEHEVLAMLTETLRKKDAESDRERVTTLLGEYRADGLAVVGLRATKRALEAGQVDELILTSVPETIDAGTGAQSIGAARDAERAADDLVALARRTGAGIRFVQDPALLQPAGGVGAFLRFKM